MLPDPHNAQAGIPVPGCDKLRRLNKSLHGFGGSPDIIVDYDAHGFGRGYGSRLRTYVEKGRPLSHYREVFLAERGDPTTGVHEPLTIIGVQRLMKRLEQVSGVHCNPHRLRHTFATRCADADVPMFQLQEALGHKSLDMVRRYYTTSKQAMARGFYRAFGATSLVI